MSKKIWEPGKSGNIGYITDYQRLKSTIKVATFSATGGNNQLRYR
jgi:hypothetical protein